MPEQDKALLREKDTAKAAAIYESTDSRKIRDTSWWGQAEVLAERSAPLDALPEMPPKLADVIGWPRATRAGRWGPRGGGGTCARNFVL